MVRPQSGRLFKRSGQAVGHVVNTHLEPEYAVCGPATKTLPKAHGLGALAATSQHANCGVANLHRSLYALAVPDSWISDEMRSVVGQQFGTPRRSVPISLSDIRKWALAIYYPEIPPRLFWDEEYAHSTRHGGVVAPEEFNPFAWFTADGPVMPPTFEEGEGEEISAIGFEQELGVKGPATRFVLVGGVEMVHGARMRPGDVITAGLTTLLEYRERQTRLGLALFTIGETIWTNQNEEMVRITRGTVIRY